VGNQLLGQFGLVDDLHDCMSGAFHGEVHGAVWVDKDSRSPWTDSKDPRQHRVIVNSPKLVGMLGPVTPSVLWRIWTGSLAFPGVGRCSHTSRQRRCSHLWLKLKPSRLKMR
jgi:hypothetical protein